MPARRERQAGGNTDGCKRRVCHSALVSDRSWSSTDAHASLLESRHTQMHRHTRALAHCLSSRAVLLHWLMGSRVITDSRTHAGTQARHTAVHTRKLAHTRLSASVIPEHREGGRVEGVYPLTCQHQPCCSWSSDTIWEQIAGAPVPGQSTEGHKLRCKARAFSPCCWENSNMFWGFFFQTNKH